MKLYYYYLVIIFLSFLFGFFGECMGQSYNSEITSAYYGSFGGYDIPLKPIEKIDKKEAFSRNTYCIAFFNNKGQIIRFEKYLNGRLFFQHNYKYHDNGKIKENEGIDIDGVIRINSFDLNGKPLKP
jgi:hypothetical protein